MLTRRTGYRCAIMVFLLSAIAPSTRPAGAQCSGQLIDTIRPTYIDSHDRFGQSIAVDGGWVAVGSPGDDPQPGTSSGTVTMYRIVPGSNGPELVESQRLAPPSPQSGAQFGASVALDGHTLLVGSPYDDSLAHNAGGAHIFKYDGSSWSWHAQLLPFDYEANDQAGAAVALDGDRIAIGAPGRRCCGDTIVAGRVHVYRQVNDGFWQYDDTFSDPAQGTTALLGSTVALHDDLLLVGAPSGSGQILVFQDNGVTYEFESRLLPQTATAGQFGSALAIEANRLFVGCPRDAIDGDESGAVHVFQANAFQQWMPSGVLRPLSPGPGTQFGWSVSAHERSLVIGAAEPLGLSQLPGAAFLFNRVQGQWVQRDRVSPTYVDNHAEFSRAVACYGELVLVGVPNRREFLPGFGDVAVYGASHDCSCAADLAGEDGSVDVFDLLELLGHWGGGASGAGLALPYDTVDVFDLLRLLDRWGACP